METVLAGVTMDFLRHDRAFNRPMRSCPGDNGRQGECAIDAPLARLSLVELRPRRARFRFTRQAHCIAFPNGIEENNQVVGRCSLGGASCRSRPNYGARPFAGWVDARKGKPVPEAGPPHQTSILPRAAWLNSLTIPLVTTE